MFSAKGGKAWKGGLCTLIFARGGQVSRKVANIVRFSQKVAKSVERWPLLFDFCKRWPSQQKGGQSCAIFAKGGQVSKKVANVVRFSRKVAKSVKRWPMLCDFYKRWPSLKRWPLNDICWGGQVSRKVANVVRFSRKVAKLIRWPLYPYFLKRWPLYDIWKKVAKPESGSSLLGGLRWA